MRQPFLFCAQDVLCLLVSASVLSFTLGTGYSEEFRGSSARETPSMRQTSGFGTDHPRLRAAMAAQRKHMHRLLDIAGVVATATGMAPDGEPVVKVFTAQAGIAGLPLSVEGVPVQAQVAGRFYAFNGPTPTERWPRPVPIGVSTGHPSITAGTIGARVRHGTNVYALSNNHVYADINTAAMGDGVLQPGVFDGGVRPHDSIGQLFDFEPIRFCTIFFIWLICSDVNTIDAAIAITSASLVGTATPPDGYGSPHPALHPVYGNPDVSGDENLGLLLGESVHKYGRTTGWTSGTVDAINATVDVCYDQACSLVARFVDQIVITPGTFSAGGDSGSLIVGQNGNHPVGLLFAGSNTNTLANRIDLVLNRFAVNIDSDAGGPMLAIKDVTITEGNSGTVTAVFTVSLSAASSAPVTVDFATFDGTATVADGDYVPASGTLLFAPGEVLQSISIMVREDSTDEPDETFFVALSTPVNATIADSQGQGSILNDDVSLVAGPHLRVGRVWASTMDWTTVPLNHDYGANMVVVCTANYDKNPAGAVATPVVPHVRNASGNSFQVKLVAAVAWTFEVSEAWVHCMVVEAGVYNEAEHGVKMEAVKFTSTVTDRSPSWVGQKRAYLQAYTTPVVVGQVMSLHSYDASLAFDLWSVFWSRGSSKGAPPSSTVLRVGKHAGEDPRVRSNETLGYVVLEAGTGSIGAINYVAGVGPDSIKGVGNKPPYRYAISGLSSAATAIVSQAAMDNANGGWAILYGDNPILASGLNIAIDEDGAWDTERSHSTEQVMYIVFE